MKKTSSPKLVAGTRLSMVLQKVVEYYLLVHENTPGKQFIQSRKGYSKISITNDQNWKVVIQLKISGTRIEIFENFGSGTRTNIFFRLLVRVRFGHFVDSGTRKPETSFKTFSKHFLYHPFPKDFISQVFRNPKKTSTLTSLHYFIWMCWAWIWC